MHVLNLGKYMFINNLRSKDFLAYSFLVNALYVKNSLVFSLLNTIFNVKKQSCSSIELFNYKYTIE